VICPFAGGTWSKKPKTWPAFAAFVADTLPQFGRPIVICPGPGEESIARDQFARAICLEGVGLGAYAALLSEAALMISNDTGPGHIAAAVNAPLVSVLGPSDPAQWGAWGPSVTFVRADSGAGDGADDGWPSIDAVRAAVAQRLGPA
jgi:heptosyltransferase-2